MGYVNQTIASGDADKTIRYWQSEGVTPAEAMAALTGVDPEQCNEAEWRDVYWQIVKAQETTTPKASDTL